MFCISQISRKELLRRGEKAIFFILINRFLFYFNITIRKSQDSKQDTR